MASLCSAVQRKCNRRSCGVFHPLQGVAHQDPAHRISDFALAGATIPYQTPLTSYLTGLVAHGQENTTLWLAPAPAERPSRPESCSRWSARGKTRPQIRPSLRSVGQWRGVALSSLASKVPWTTALSTGVPRHTGKPTPPATTVRSHRSSNSVANTQLIDGPACHVAPAARVASSVEWPPSRLKQPYRAMMTCNAPGLSSRPGRSGSISTAAELARPATTRSLAKPSWLIQLPEPNYRGSPTEFLQLSPIIVQNQQVVRADAYQVERARNEEDVGVTHAELTQFLKCKPADEP